MTCPDKYLNRIFPGDCLEVLAQLPEQSVHCTISSPPYWGLRDYKIPGRQWSDGWFGSHGLEPTLEMFIQHEVEILRAIRRVLRDDCVVWWNLGDSYATTPAGNKNPQNLGVSNWIGGTGNQNVSDKLKMSGLKPLDLCGVPWRVALAAQADGWYLRSAIIWAKGESFNPDRSGSVMPESVNGVRWERCRVKVAGSRVYHEGLKDEGYAEGSCNDRKAQWQDCPGCAKCRDTHGYVLREGSWRPTSAYEMVFMLTKTANYFCDGESGKENSITDPNSKASMMFGSKNGKLNTVEKAHAVDLGHKWEVTPSRNLRNVFSIPGCDTDVWRINTKGFKEAHFATFTPDLVKPMIEIATSERCCPTCGKSWVRVVKSETAPKDVYTKTMKPETISAIGDHTVGIGQKYQNWLNEHPTQTLGWMPGCSHYPKQASLADYDKLDTTPCIVLDPFMGSGTVALVAKRMGRHYIGIEISAPYCAMAEKRLAELGDLI
jgi:DNA modification methylase